MIRDAAPAVRRRHRGRLAVVVVVVILLGAAGFVGLRYALRAHPGPKSLNSAVKAFRSERSAGTDQNARYRAPAAGVYQLRGQGTEVVSFPPNSQDDGPVMPASVSYIASGCWRWHVDYNVAHWEEYDFCPRNGQLLIAANRESASWDFGTLTVENLARFACPPASTVLSSDPRAEEAYSWSCTGTNTAVKGQSLSTTAARIVGTGTMRIGGTVVPVIHQRQQTTISGGQRGAAVEDWWFAASSGLPLRVERQITIRSDSPLGTITYHEAGSWQTTSLRPRTR